MRIHYRSSTEKSADVTHCASLATSEIANLWKSAVYYSMIDHSQRYFHETAQDSDIRQLLARGLDIVGVRAHKAAQFLESENHPAPSGYSENDIDYSAPRLFTDEFYLYFLLKATRMALTLDSSAFTTSIRPDIREFYRQSVERDMVLFEDITDVLLAKGLYARPPSITTADRIDYVKDRSFLAGFLNEPRPLLADEVSQLHLEIITNQLGGVYLRGFAQVARSDQVKSYMLRGAKLAEKVVKVFSSKLTECDLVVSLQNEIHLSSSTKPPYSDRLMMNLVMALSTLGTSSYAMSVAVSPRHDLQYDYGRLMAEAAKFYADGLNILIDQGWFEEPPRVMDRRELIGGTAH